MNAEKGPVIWLELGQDTLRQGNISLEQQALNAQNISGHQRPIIPGGPSPLPDTDFPLAALQTQLQTDGVATQMSNQPGEESCNSLFYQLLTAENQLQTWPAKGQPMSILMQVLLVHVGVGIPQADAQTFSQQIIEAILDADATIKLN